MVVGSIALLKAALIPVVRDTADAPLTVTVVFTMGGVLSAPAPVVKL